MTDIPDASTLSGMLLILAAFFAVVVGRYLFISGAFHLYFYVWKREQWKNRKLSAKSISRKQFSREVLYSTITAFIFALAGALVVLLWQQGYTMIYSDIYEYGIWYLPVSLIIYMLIHETYYYWLHRWMHHPSIFRYVHKVHHQSTSTSAWTAFSFHPLEGLLQAIFLPVLLLAIPIHPYILLLQLTLMTLSSVVNHLDIEIYPRNFDKHFLGRWLIGATHHSLHHKQFKYNFGLYFTFWDKWKKTESPSYHSVFEDTTNKD